MKRALALLAASVVCAGAGAAEFKRLSSVHIQRLLAQRVITDDAHGSDRSDPDGELQSIELGQANTGKWRVAGNELCTVRSAQKPVEECFEVWTRDDDIELRRDGVAEIAALLRPRNR